MIRLLILLLMVYIGYRVMKTLLAGTRAENRRAPDDGASPTHRDPVCGVYVPEDDAVVGTLEGTKHYFCSMDCLEKFRERLDHTPT